MRATAVVLLLSIPGAIGRGFIPQSLLKVKSKAADGDGRRGDINRGLEECPPALDTSTGLCGLPLDTVEKWQACANACGAAICCQQGTCCEGGCPGPPCTTCFSYLPCENLGDGPPNPPNNNGTDPGLGSCSVLSVDYYKGWNLHFRIDEIQAKSLMPYSWFHPFQLSLEGSASKHQTEGSKSSKVPSKGQIRALNGAGKGLFSSNPRSSSEDPGYYASFYAATIGVDVEEFGGEVRVGRADLFTYAIDPYGEPSLVFLAAFLEVPVPFQANDEVLQAYKKSIMDLALDSTTGKLAYPHFFAFDFVINETGFRIGGGDLPDGAIEIIKDCEGRSTSFSRDFILANSLAYRSTIDKNVNYFNKDFIAANVQSFPVKDWCLPVQNVQFLQDMLPNSVFESVQSYGDSSNAITWQYEDSTISSGTPYLTLAEKKERIDFKHLAFSSIWSQRAGSIAAGTAETLFKLLVHKDSLYINWELSEGGVNLLSSTLGLQDLGLTMTPIKIVADEDPRYFLSLNAYISTIEGLDALQGQNATGVRFEYSIYVSDSNSQGSGPYYMVIDAQSSIASFDPVSGEVPASDLSYSRIENFLLIGSSDWEAEVLVEEGMPLSVEKDWITANDRIYWSNGVTDQVFFDKNFTLQHPIKATLNSISGDFAWEEFLVDAENPVHAFVYAKPLDFVIMPWSNLNTVQPPPLGGALQGIKNTIYGGLALLSSTLISMGQQEPLVDILAYGKYPDNPKVYLNFEIPPEMLPMMERAIGLPDQYHIVPMAMTERSEPKYKMSLTLLNQTLLYDGEEIRQATWSVYIVDEDGETYLHEFHTERSAVGLDIEQEFPFLKPPAEVFEVTARDDVLDVLIVNGSFRFDASISLPKDSTSERIKLTNKWVHAHDRVYWKKGVYENVYYNGGLWDAKVIPAAIDSTRVSLIAPWADFVSDAPYEVYYFDADVILISNPWFNIEEI